MHWIYLLHEFHNLSWITEVPFQFPYMQIWTALSNRDYTGFESELLASQVRLRTPWATEQTYVYEKP